VAEKTDSSVRKATQIDCHVGARLRLRRLQLGLTQEELGVSIGRGFKQIRKYEQGQNRIKAGMLYQLALALDVDVEYFFEGLDAPADVIDLPHLEGQELAQHFQAIKPVKRRRALVALVKTIAECHDIQRHWR